MLVHILQGRHLTLNSSFPDSGLTSVVVDVTSSSCFAGVSQCHKDSLVFSVCSKPPIRWNQGFIHIHTNMHARTHTHTDAKRGNKPEVDCLRKGLKGGIISSLTDPPLAAVICPSTRSVTGASTTERGRSQGNYIPSRPPQQNDLVAICTSHCRLTAGIEAYSSECASLLSVYCECPTAQQCCLRRQRPRHTHNWISLSG